MPIKSKSGRVFNLPTDEEEAAIRKGIRSDSDAVELTDQELTELRPLAELSRAGCSEAEVTKERVTIPLSSEVAEYFRATGNDWQTRIDEALKAYVEAHR